MWEPKSYLFEEDQGDILLFSRIKETIRKIGSENKITTSKELQNNNINSDIVGIPDGFSQFQIPIILNGRSALFHTVADPLAYFPDHVHRMASVFRYIVFGSITSNGIELASGDWMYVPAGVHYWIKAGGEGASIIHAYDPT